MPHSCVAADGVWFWFLFSLFVLIWAHAPRQVLQAVMSHQHLLSALPRDTSVVGSKVCVCCCCKLQRHNAVFLYELRMYRALLTGFIYGRPSGRKGRTQHPTLANEEADPEGSVSCKVIVLITTQT